MIHKVIIDFRGIVDRFLDPRLSDPEWNLVENERRGAWKELEPAAIAAKVQQWRDAKPPSVPISTTDEGKRSKADPARNAREDLLSYLFSLMADKLDKVATFRREILKGSLLNIAEVGPWIMRHLSEEKYSVWLEVPVRPDAQNSVYTNRPVVVSEDLPATGFDLKWLEYSIPDQPSQKVAIAARGVLDRLRGVSEHVAEQAACSRSDATTFILSGRPIPFYSCEQKVVISSTDLCSALNRIELRIDPTVSPRQVAEVYRRVRAHVFGKRYRAMSEKHIRLALFTFSRRYDGRDEPLKSAMPAWNKQYGKWRYTKETVFGRDRLAAKRRALESLDNASPTSRRTVDDWLVGKTAGTSSKLAKASSTEKRRGKRQ